MQWWKIALNGILIAIAGYEVGKESSAEQNSENRLVRYEPHPIIETKEELPDKWLAVVACVIIGLIVAIAISIKRYIKNKLRRLNNVQQRV